jgi:hypothetical protein
MSGADVLLQSNVMIDHFENQIRLLNDETDEVLENALVKI